MTRGHLVRDHLGNPVIISGFHVDITESETMRAHFLQEKEKYLDIIEATRAGTWEWNIQTGENIYNERWAEIVGYTMKELEPITDDTWASLVHPDDLVRSDEIVQSLFYREKEYYSMECRMRHKDGHWVWVLDKGKVVRWTEDGIPLQMFGTHINITEAKLLEMEVKQREDNYRLLVESSYNIVYRLDKDGIYCLYRLPGRRCLDIPLKRLWDSPSNLMCIRMTFIGYRNFSGTSSIQESGWRQRITDCCTRMVPTTGLPPMQCQSWMSCGRTESP